MFPEKMKKQGIFQTFPECYEPCIYIYTGISFKSIFHTKQLSRSRNKSNLTALYIVVVFLGILTHTFYIEKRRLRQVRRKEIKHNKIRRKRTEIFPDIKRTTS